MIANGKIIPIKPFASKAIPMKTWKKPSDAETMGRGDAEISDSTSFFDCQIKKHTRAAVMGNVIMMSKLAPREKTRMPSVEAAIRARWLA